MKRNLFLKISFLIILPILFFSFSNKIFAVNPGTIPASVDCSGNTSCALLDSDSSSINFGCANCNVSIDCHSDIGLTGYAFGENIGWINLAPTNGGVTMTANNSGILTGYAWGENAGWVNFAPTNGGVTISKIDPTKGQFNGWAWSQNYGWIKFDCGVAGACVDSTWTPCGGGSTDLPDDCSDGSDNDNDGLIDENDPGCHEDFDLTKIWYQNDQDETNDVCLNLDGNQAILPLGYLPSIPPDWICNPDPLFLTVQIQNPISGTYFSADATLEEIDGSTLPVADFMVNKISAKVTGAPDTGSVKFFINNDPIGIVGTLKSSTTDIYEIDNQSFTAQCPLPNSTEVFPKIFTIRVEAKNSTLVLSDSDSVEINVGKPCGTTATECSDSDDNDDDGGIDYVPESDPPIAGGDPDCDHYDDPSEDGDYCVLNPDVDACFCLVPENQDLDRCFCFVPENQGTERCPLPPPPIIPVEETCFTNPSLCTCADDPNLPGCEEPGGGELNPCDIDPSAPGCVAPSIIAEVFPPAVVEQINLGLKIAATASVAVAGVISLATALFLNPLAAPELVLIPVRLWSLLLTGLGIKKRRKPWGTVYDSITKQPLDPVYVSLRNLEGAEIASSITDIDGRYGFLVKPGVYKVVPRKTNYIFPSDKLSKAFRDEFYANLYFGDYININDAGEVIVKNIPMDAVNFDWNEFEKNKKKLYKFYSKRELLIAKISNWLFGIGFTIAGTALIISPEKYNIIIFGAYIFMFVLRKTSFRLKAKGRLFDKDGSPLSFASVRAYAVDTNVEIAHQAADEMGRYHILLPNGMYYVKIEKKNNDGSYSVVHTSNYFKVAHGVLNKVFNI